MFFFFHKSIFGSFLTNLNCIFQQPLGWKRSKSKVTSNNTSYNNAKARIYKVNINGWKVIRFIKSENWIVHKNQDFFSLFEIPPIESSKLEKNEIFHVTFFLFFKFQNYYYFFKLVLNPLFAQLIVVMFYFFFVRQSMISLESTYKKIPIKLHY